MAFQPLPHTIVALDVVGSGQLDDQLLLAVRADVRMIVGSVLARQGIDIASLESHDLGDGIRLVVPGLITPPALLDPFVPNLDTALRQQRKRASAEARLRLRIAVHHGLVHQDGGSAAGEPLRITARLLDAAGVRQAIALADDANLVLVVSQQMFESVVRHGYGLDPALYQKISVREKETAATAWIYVPGHTPHLSIDESPGREIPPPSTAGSGPAMRQSEVRVDAETATFHGPVVGGDYHP